MTLRLAGVLADARTLWRRERELLLPIAGVFYFLPALALRLFIAEPKIADVAEEQALRLTLDWLSTNAPWFVLQLALQLFGSAVLMVLLLDRERPSAGQAIGKGAMLMPRLIGGSVVLLVPIGALGTLLLGVGGALSVMLAIPLMFYVLGRSFVLLPLLVAEQQRGIFDSVIAALRRTGGNGWRLVMLSMLIYLPLMVFGQILAGIGEGAAPAGGAIVALCVSVLGAAAGLCQLLFQVAAYRALTEPRQGM